MTILYFYSRTSHCLAPFFSSLGWRAYPRLEPTTAGLLLRIARRCIPIPSTAEASFLTMPPPTTCACVIACITPIFVPALCRRHAKSPDL